MVHSQQYYAPLYKPVKMKEKQVNHVKDIITKFFYKDNQLCFQILIRMDSGITHYFGEYVDFAEYKKCFMSLQKAKASGNRIDIPEKGHAEDFTVSKVA
jgi:hypothetical protein